MSKTRRPAPALAGLFLLVAGGLQGCASLPSSGPTARDVLKDQQSAAPFPFQIVDLSPQAVGEANRLVEGQGSQLSALARTGPLDEIGPGDVLQVTIFEVGASLFSSSAALSPLAASAGAAAPPTAAGQNLPPITVGESGRVVLPYVGEIQAAGRTPEALQAEVAERLRARSQAPQVIVSVRENLSNTVVVGGEVKKPGRLALTLQQDRLLDAIAGAGGGNYPVQDLLVRITRQGQSAEMRLDRVHANGDDNLLLQPQDRIELIYRPRTFTVFGAAKVGEVPFQYPRVTLAEALARASGPLDQQADPTAVFVFRYTPESAEGDAGPKAQPVAYRLDLMHAQSYFLAQNFEMRPRDVVFIANARINEVTKFMQILNLFFSPAYTAKVVTQ